MSLGSSIRHEKQLKIMQQNTAAPPELQGMHK